MTSDPNLSQLRGQIKKVMIPLLIKIFELKLAAQQAKMPPSRLQKKQEESSEEILSQFKSLQEDLSLLQVWCASCQKQLEKALRETGAVEEEASSPTISSGGEKVALSTLAGRISTSREGEAAAPAALEENLAPEESEKMDKAAKFFSETISSKTSASEPPLSNWLNKFLGRS